MIIIVILVELELKAAILIVDEVDRRLPRSALTTPSPARRHRRRPAYGLSFFPFKKRFARAAATNFIDAYDVT